MRFQLPSFAFYQPDVRARAGSEPARRSVPRCCIVANLAGDLDRFCARPGTSASRSPKNPRNCTSRTLYAQEAADVETTHGLAQSQTARSGTNYNRAGADLLVEDPDGGAESIMVIINTFQITPLPPAMARANGRRNPSIPGGHLLSVETQSDWDALVQFFIAALQRPEAFPGVRQEPLCVATRAISSRMKGSFT